MLSSIAIAAWAMASVAFGHNLDMRSDYLGFDKATLDMFEARSLAGQTLLQPGDTVGLVVKATPNAGTPTGAGGYSTFFVPVGTQVVQAEYGRVDATGNFQPMAVKGQSILALGDGQMGAKKTTSLIGLTLGPNINGQTALAVDGSGYANGTMVGVYSDTGIFYSTDPKTAWQSWVNTGGLDGSLGTTSDNKVTTNSGRIVTPTTRWDAEQLLAFGVKSAILDPIDGRGNAPWGMASAVAGPEGGYAWCFDKTYWDSHSSDPNRAKNSVTTGPWRRIQYEGSQASKDTPGLRSTTTGYAAVDASSIGYALSPANPLPPTTSLTDNTSPKAVRVAWGNIELYRPEYARLQLKINVGAGQNGSPFDSAGFLRAFADTFGGDAGGEYRNFDHLWHYYNPSTAALSGRPFIFKQVSKPLVMPNEVFSYKIWLINFGTSTLTNVTVQDTLPAGVQFVSASPAQSSGPSPLTWNFPTLAPQAMQAITVTARATGTGVLVNTVCSSSDQYATECTTDTTVVSGQPLLYADKTVTPTTALPGGTVYYTMTIANEGSAPSAVPLVINEALPTGFSYNALMSAQINGAPSAPGVVTVAVPGAGIPVFTVNQAINPGQSVAITFKARISTYELPGRYCNRYSFTNNGRVNSTGALACVTVTGIHMGLGNLVYFDENNDGHANPGEGVANVLLELYKDGDTAGVTPPLATTTSAPDGTYFFDFLDPGIYFVRVPPAMFQAGGPLFGKVAIAATLFGDDDVGQDGLNNTIPASEGVVCKPVYLFAGQSATDENGETGVNHDTDNDNDASVDMTVDFGFQIPVGIGNLVFIDANHNGQADPGEGVGGVKVEIYAASAPPGVGQYLFSTTTTADGHYLFDHLAIGNYIVYITPGNFLFNHPLAGLLSLPDLNGQPNGDDDVGENGIDAISPVYTGISSNVVNIVPGLAPTSSVGGETGFLADEDSAEDNKIDLTVDFGFTDLPSPVVGLGNLVFKDADGNLFYDDGEGVDGVVVQLFPDTVTDPLTATPLATTTSANGGEYYFGNLLPGQYFVFIPPTNFQPGGPLISTLSIPGQVADVLDDDQNENGDDPLDPSTSGVRSTSINLAVGMEPTALASEAGFKSYVDDGSDSNNNLTIDFGFYETVGVGNVVFKDLNGNGRYDDGEGVDGVTLQLFLPGDEPQTAIPQATTLSANGGRYSFTRLNKGDYFIYIPGSQFAIGAPLFGLLSVPDTTTSGHGDDNMGEDGIDASIPGASGIASRVFTLAPGTGPTDATTELGVGAADDNAADADFDATIDFGFYDSGLALLGIGNLVFIDANHNGHYDAGEGAPNIHVQLFPVTAQPLSDTPISISLTDASGTYLLRTAIPGDYIVFIPGSEFEKGKPLYGLMSLPGNGGDDGVDDDFDENGIDSPHPNITGIRSVSMHLAPGTQPIDGGGETGFQATSDNLKDSDCNLTVDFGFDHLCPTFSIAPSTVPGAYLGNSYSQTFSTTAGYGPYTWDLAAGTLPPGTSLDSFGHLVGVTSELGTFQFSVRVTDDTGCTGTMAYQVNVIPPPTVGLGNCVYIDVNHNGVNDGNEGVAGVEVELFLAGDDPTIDAPLAEVDTDASGLYAFTGLTPGDYFVFIPPAEFAVDRPLYNCLSITGTNSAHGVDDNAIGNDNGIDAPQPDLTGIISSTAHLAFGSAPVDGGTEAGVDETSDNDNDSNTDLTIDLGFQLACPTITVSPGSLPSATESFAYNQTLQASGGAGAITFTQLSGQLPPGFSLSPAGVLSGNTTTKGSFAFTIRATDVNNCSTDAPLTLVVNGRLAVGNLVFFDVNGNGRADTGEGVDGVNVQVYHSTDTPGTSTPVATATTTNGGLYLMDGLAPGDYVLHVPKAMFASGAPLANMKSVPGALTLGDDDIGEHGLDAVDPKSTGVSTAIFSLAAGAAPQNADTETGTGHASDDARDGDIDLTQDFGFVDIGAQAATFSQWSTDHGLAGNNATAAANPDGDVYPNIIEYALGLNPTSGADDIGATFSVTRNAGGGVDAKVRRRHGGQNDLTYSLEVLRDLTASAWSTTTIQPTVTNNFNGTETLTFTNLSDDPVFTAATDGLVRIRVSLDANHDGNPESTAASPIMGWQRRTLSIQNQTYSVAYMPSAVFTGKVDSVNGNSINLATSAGGTSVKSLIGGGKAYYIDVISGSQRGHRWEIDETNSTTTSLALLPAQQGSTQSSVPASLASDIISVRPHWRMSDIFPVADYHATNNSSTADQVILWDPATKGYVTLWMSNFFGQSHWRQVGVASLFTTEDSRALAPVECVFAKPRTNPVAVFSSGELRTWPFAMPLKAGVNFIGNPFPLPQSPQTWGMTVAGGFTGSSNPSLSDRIYFWKGDMTTSAGYTTYQLFKAGSREIWKDVSSTDLNTNYGLQDLFSTCHGAFINSVNGKADWTIPAPTIP